VGLQGGPDGDFLIGGEQRDLLMGEGGDDFLGAKEQGTPQADVVQGGADDDTAQIDAADNPQLTGVEHLIF
jgi:hypothetical protein